MIPLNTNVKVVDDVGKADSKFIGKVGKVIAYKPNKFRPDCTIPVVQLEDGQIISGVTLWYEPVKTELCEADLKTFFATLHEFRQVMLELLEHYEVTQDLDGLEKLIAAVKTIVPEKKV